VCQFIPGTILLSRKQCHDTARLQVTCPGVGISYKYFHYPCRRGCGFVGRGLFPRSKRLRVNLGVDFATKPIRPQEQRCMVLDLTTPAGMQQRFPHINELARWALTIALESG